MWRVRPSRACHASHLISHLYGHCAKLFSNPHFLIDTDRTQPLFCLICITTLSLQCRNLQKEFLVHNTSGKVNLTANYFQGKIVYRQRQKTIKVATIRSFAN